MGRRIFLVLASFLLVGAALYAYATTTRQNFTITAKPPVASGRTITTMTIQNGDSSHPIVPKASGYPYIAGQAFVRSNSNGIASTGINNYPICEDANNNAQLPCQWDDIATYRENGDDGSWREATLSVLLPATSPQYDAVPGGSGLAACTVKPCPGKFQIKFVNVAGAYVQSVRSAVNVAGAYAPNALGSISDICNGHDINLVLTDVRNQDDSMRGPSGHTGTLIFDTCAAINNTGRDAPRQFAQGSVRNGWLVQGPPRYSDGSADPLLYVKCYMSQTYTLSGGLGPLQHMCSVHNSWMNVAAGSVGNAGAPGPVGFANDPQAISYRPVLYDGSTAILDWGTSYWDETVADTALDVSSGVWTIPALGPATNPMAWGRGNAFRYSDTAVPPTATQGTQGGPFAQGQLMFDCAAVYCGNPQDLVYDPTRILLSKYPFAGQESMPAYSAQGTGNSVFSWRVYHYVRVAWWTVDPKGFENWSPPGSTTRYVDDLQPQFTAAEKTYWKQTGTIPPLLDLDPSNFDVFPGNDDQKNTRYAPLDLVGFSLGTGVGGRPDIGLQNEYVSEWWSAQTPDYWQFIRANALVGMGGQAQGDLLNEATGRMPTLNNGRPGANHAGAGTPYAGLGALFPNTRLFGGSLIEQGVVPALENVPYSDCTISSQCSNMAFGPIFTLTDNTHQSAFALGVYQVSGSEMYVPALEDAGLRAQYGYGGLCNWLVNSGVTGDGMDCTINGVTYYTLLGPGDERRGQAWAMRDVAAAAAFGDDSFYGPERIYFNDDLTETYWFNVACGLGCGLIDPPAPTSGIVLGGGEGTLSPSISPGNNDILNNVDATFFDGYITQSAYLQWSLLHAPMAKDYLSQQYRLYAATCGDDGTTPPVGNSPSSLFCGVYYYGNPMKSLSPYVLNKTDGGDYQLDNWMGGNTVTFTAGSKTLSPLSSTVWITEWPWTTKVKFFNYPGCQALPMQLTDGVWYYIVNNDPNTGAFQVATSPGSGTASGLNNASNSALGPFTTSGGASYSGDVCNVMLRVDASVAAVSPTAGLNTAFLDNGYATFSLAGITGLIVANQSLGNLFPSALYLRNNMLARWNNNTGGWTVMNSVGGDDIANVLWDPTIVLQ